LSEADYFTVIARYKAREFLRRNDPGDLELAEEVEELPEFLCKKKPLLAFRKSMLTTRSSSPVWSHRFW
jgi:hypothetical protein